MGLRLSFLDGFSALIWGEMRGDTGAVSIDGHAWPSSDASCRLPRFGMPARGAFERADPILV